MIKTIITKQGETIEDLDKKVNEFMRLRKQNLPVRTESFVTPAGDWHKATIFFDERFDQATPPLNLDGEEITEEEVNMNVLEEMHQEEYQGSRKGSDNKLGALWLQKDKTISGNFKDERIVIPEQWNPKIQALQGNSKLEVTMKGEKVMVFGNKFKKSNPKAPDWVIFRKTN